MDIDLAGLRCERDVLLKVLRAYVELGAGIVKFTSRDDLLRLSGANDRRRHTSTNFLAARFEYLGDSDRGYVKPEKVSALLNSRPGSKYSLECHAIPLGWSDEFEDRDIKRGEGVDMHIPTLKSALSYLLRLDFGKINDQIYHGVIFKGAEMITTNGPIMLIQNGVPVVTTAPRVLGWDSAISLYSLLRTDYVTSVQMHVKKTGIFGVRVELADEVEIFYWTKPRFSTLEEFTDPRPPMHPHSVGFVVHGPFLESVATSAVAAVQQGEIPVLQMNTKETGLGYTVYGADSLHTQPPRGIYQGEIPMVRSMANTDHVALTVRADHLIQAIKGVGDSIQFIVPYHDALGLQIHPIDPFYINGNGSQFALMAQFILDRNQTYHLEKLRRKVMNAREGL